MSARQPAARRSSAPPTRSTGPPAAWSTCPTPRSCSASCHPADVLAALVDGPVIVDNDVNWAARAERDASRQPSTATTSPTCYLGEGLGCAVVSDGEVRRGHARTRRRDRPRPRRPARTAGPSAFTDVFGALGLRQPGIDRDRRPRAAGSGRMPTSASTRSAGNPGQSHLRRPRRPWSPSATRRSSSSAERGAPRPSSSTPSPPSSSDSPAMSRSGPRGSPTHLPSPAPGTTHSTSYQATIATSTRSP